MRERKKFHNVCHRKQNKWLQYVVKAKKKKLFPCIWRLTNTTKPISIGIFHIRISRKSFTRFSYRYQQSSVNKLTTRWKKFHCSLHTVVPFPCASSSSSASLPAEILCAIGSGSSKIVKILFVMIFGERKRKTFSVVILSCFPPVRISRQIACGEKEK